MKTHLGPPSRDFNGAEFAVVIALAFGLSIVESVSRAFSYTGHPIEFGDADLIWTVAYELVIGAIMALVLRSRGWKWADFAVHYSRGSTLFGILLALAILAVWEVFERLVGAVPTNASAGLPYVAVVSIINPCFEELLVLAYVVQALRKRFGLTTAANCSLLIRLLYHLYEGPLGVMPIAIFGLVATLVYVRMGRLWPVMVMHGILDFVGLATA